MWRFLILVCVQWCVLNTREPTYAQTPLRSTIQQDKSPHSSSVSRGSSDHTFTLQLQLTRAEIKTFRWQLFAEQISVMTSPFQIDLAQPRLWPCPLATHVYQEDESLHHSWVSISARSARWRAGQFALIEPRLHLMSTSVPLPSLMFDPLHPKLGSLHLGWDQGALWAEVGPALRVDNVSVTPLFITRWGRMGLGTHIHHKTKSMSASALPKFTEPRTSFVNLNSNWAGLKLNVTGRSTWGLTRQSFLPPLSSQDQALIDSPQRLTSRYLIAKKWGRSNSLSSPTYLLSLRHLHETLPRRAQRGALGLWGTWNQRHVLPWRFNVLTLELQVSEELTALYRAGMRETSRDITPNALSVFSEGRADANYIMAHQIRSIFDVLHQSRAGHIRVRFGGGDLRLQNQGQSWFWAGTEYTFAAHRRYKGQHLHLLQITPRWVESIIGIGDQPSHAYTELGVTSRHTIRGPGYMWDGEVWWGQQSDHLDSNLSVTYRTRLEIDRWIIERQERRGQRGLLLTSRQWASWRWGSARPSSDLPTTINAPRGDRVKINEAWGSERTWGGYISLAFISDLTQRPLFYRSITLLELVPLSQRQVPVATLPLINSSVSQSSSRSRVEDMLNVHERVPQEYGYLALGLGRAPIRVEWTGVFRAAMTPTDSGRAVPPISFAAQQRLTWVGRCGCWSISLDLGLAHLDPQVILSDIDRSAETYSASTYEWRGGLKAHLGLPAPRVFSSAFTPLERGLH